MLPTLLSPWLWLLLAALAFTLSALMLAPPSQAQTSTKVFFTESNWSASEVGAHGLRYTNRYTIGIDPPLDTSGNSVHIRIKSTSTATQGEDYTLAAPNDDPDTTTKVVRLRQGASEVSFRIWFRPDRKDEGQETVDFELVAVEHAPYAVTAGNGVDRFPETQLVIRDNSRPIPANADSRRGIRVQPKSASVGADSTVSYGISLNTAPAADVTVKAYFDTRDDAVDLGAQSSGMSVSPASLTFTSMDWGTEQFFTVSPGDSPFGRYLILHGLESDDNNYSTDDWFKGPGVDGRTHIRVTVTVGGL